MCKKNKITYAYQSTFQLSRIEQWLQHMPTTPTSVELVLRVSACFVRLLGVWLSFLTSEHVP